MSKLIVEVCTIDKLEDLENAQKLVMATVKGWQCLVGKGQHVIGERVVFIPPDAVVSQEMIEKEKLEYLREHNGRLRTIKLRGYISQGLVLPCTCLAGKIGNEDFGRAWAIGTDVADLLGITKYEPVLKALGGPKKEYVSEQWAKYRAGEITLRRFVAKSVGIIKAKYFKKPKLSNPEFKGYTDINNIKHYPTVFEEGEEVVITEKIHGTNFRAGSVPAKLTWLNKLLGKGLYEFVYGSHHVQKTCLSGKGFYGEDVYGKIAARYALQTLIPNGFTLYGEIYGPKIQELTYGATQLEVAFFDLTYNGKYQDFKLFEDFCKDRNLPMVPILFRGKYSEGILKLSTDGPTVQGKGCHIREGAVIKPEVEKFDNRCGRKILKSVSAQYLLTKKQDAPEEYVDDNPEYAH